MSTFAQNRFGLSDSLVETVRTVAEGKTKFKVSGRSGSLANRYLENSETHVWARNPDDAFKKVMKDYKMKGVSRNDIVVSPYNPTKEEIEEAKVIVKGNRVASDGQKYPWSATFKDEKAFNKWKKSTESNKYEVHFVKGASKEGLNEVKKPKGMKVEKYSDWTKRVMAKYSDVAFNEKDGGKKVEAEVRGKGIVGTFTADNPPVQSHKDGSGTLA